MAFLKVFALFLTVSAACSAMEQSCKWAMDVLEMVTDSEFSTKFRLHRNVIHAGRSYFVRLRISCENQVNPFLARSLVHSGYTPVIKLEISSYGLDGVMNMTKVTYSEGALVQFQLSSNTANLEGNFLIMNTSDATVNEMQSKTNCSDGLANDYHKILFGTEENMQSPHCNETHLCDLAWLVPLTVADSRVLARCFLTNPYEIQDASLTVHSRGFSEPAENELGEIVTALPDGITVDETMVINNVPLDMPFWLVDGFKNTDYCFFTDSEFERSSVIKVHNVSQPGLSKVCADPCFTHGIKGSVSLPDRILLSTCFGVQELRKELGSSYESKVVLRQCIREMVVSPQAFPGAVKVLAIQDSSAKIFVSNVSSGISPEFFELKDEKNRTLCEFLASNFGQGGDCIIQDASMNLIPDALYVFLASYSSHYYIVRYTNNQWETLFNFPSSLPNTSRGSDDHGDHWILLDSSVSGSLPVYLNGVTFTRNTGSDLFVWGNVLFYSPNAGEDFLWLWDFNHESNITVFTSAEDGSYAFLTDTQQVWWGHTNSAVVHYLETANKWNVGMMTSDESTSCDGAYDILSLFYAAPGQLWKVIQCQNQSSSSPCISRSQVAIQDILSHSQFMHEQTSLDDNIGNIPSIFEDESTTSKHCLKYSIVFRAPHTSHQLQHIVDVIDVPYMVNTVPVSVDFLKEYLENQRTSFIHPNTVEMSVMKDVLPEYLYLKRGESYNFTVTITLDSGYPNHGNVYWSSLDHLKLSYKVSHLELLNVSATRDVYSHKGTVQYKFTLKDSGLSQKKTAPGIHLHPVQFQVQPWQAEESCFVRKTEKGVLQGTQSMTVLLGCPPSMKIEFDHAASVNASGKSQFCDKKYGIACFLYENTFHPVFNIVDETTGNMSRFTGKYHLRIIGGGEDVYSITDYSENDIGRFNYEKYGSTSTLIWTPKAKNLGLIPTFNISDNGLQWLCGRKSPCSEISPVFPHSPEYYFKVEFSNRDTYDDSLNCDLTAQFIIRIHGLPLGSLYPATVIVATCMAFITAYVFTMYAFKRNERKLWNLTRDFLKTKKTMAETWIRKKIARSKVEPAIETSVEDCHIEGVKEG